MLGDKGLRVLRKKTGAIALSVGLALGSAFGLAAPAQAGEFLSVKDLKAMCDSLSPIEKARCDGVMIGLFDGLGASIAGSPPINQSLFCTPRAATSKQISAVMRQAVLNRPEILHLNAREAFIKVMRDAFPCNAGGGSSFSAPSSAFPTPFRNIAPASPNAVNVSPPIPPASSAPPVDLAPPPAPAVKNPFGRPTEKIAPSDFNPKVIEEEASADDGGSVFTLREDER